MVPFLIKAVLAGFAAWFTPCVLAMVPMTASFFLTQSGKPRHRPVALAAVYCLGIVGAILSLGMLVTFLGNTDVLQRVANNAWLSVGVGGLLVFFGLNLLGLYSFRAPSWLLKHTSGRESRWEILGVLSLALTSTLISSTSIFAFIGLLLTNATHGELFWPLLGVTAFSTAFALPFLFLALLPGILHRLPGSGKWINIVKVMLGLIDLGVALNFFGVADRTWHETPWLFDFQFVITVWIIISLSAGIYLLGLFRLPRWLGNFTTPAFAIIPPDRNHLNAPQAPLAKFVGLGRVAEFAEFLDKGLSHWRVMNYPDTRVPLAGKQ